MKLREVFRYELEHRLRSASTWIYAAVLFGVAFVSIHGQAEVAGPVHADSPANLVLYSVGVATFGILITAALFGDAAVRDVEVEMDHLLYTLPLGKVEYLGGRFLATLVVNVVMLLAIPLGLATATLMPYLDPAAFGPFRAAAFLQPYFIFLLPNLVLTGAVLFTVGVLARQVIPVYLAAIGLILSFLVAASSVGESGNQVLSVLGDPLGIGALEPLIRYQTATEQNTRLIGLPAVVVWNRGVWLAAAAAVLALLHRSFSFAHADGGRRRREKKRVVPELASGRVEPVAVLRVAGSFGLRTATRQTLAIARSSLAELAASRWFIVVLLVCTGLTLLFAWDDSPDTPFGTSMQPVTILVAEAILNSPIVPALFLLIAVYAGELVWKDRDVGAAEITDATPVPEGALLLGRFLAVVVMLAMVQGAIVVGGILFQALEGYHHFEIGLYLQIFFGLHLADLVLLAALGMSIHVALNHKYVGHIVVLLACVAPVVAQQSGIVRHHLLLYGRDTGWTYSDMNGFGPFVGPFIWFKLYWAAWGLLLGVIATLFWVRGRELGLRRRFTLARARFIGPVVRSAAVAAGLIIALGAFIFYNTNVLNTYVAPDERGAPLAAYEKRYGRYENIAQPTIDGVQLRVEIYPDDPAVDLRGTYRLVNRSAESLDSVHVYIRPGIEARSLSFDRPAGPVVVDDETGYRIFALAQPLEPGDSLRLTFDVTFRPRGFPNAGLQTDVVGNGAYFERSWLPYIGYQPAFELPGYETRQRFGLAPRPPVPSADDTVARRYRSGDRNEDHVNVEMIVGTAADQIAVTPGLLRRSWTENGRRYFRYETEVPISFGATVVFSGKYAVLEDRWRNVALQIFHHPTHSNDLGRMVRSMKASLDYFTTQFGPYRDSQLRIVEFPRYGGFGHAHPHTIAFAEDAFLSHVKEGEVDLPFYGTAHEIAHQWWGVQVQGAPVRGHRLLSEGLANYSAMMVTERVYGPEVTRQVYDFQMDRYLRGRTSYSHEVPLLEVTDQRDVAYGKGALALYTLREHIGEDAVNGALRRYFEKHRDGRPPYPTSLDLYAELRAVTPDSLRNLLTDLFETVTLWDVRAERAVVERTTTGTYSLTIDVMATKMRADSVGGETEVPMNDLVEIGVFAAPPDGGGRGEQLYLTRHRVTSGKQTIRITVAKEPARAGIDPYRKLIDRDREDNIVEVRAPGPT